jgi:hypothetical protein
MGTAKIPAFAFSEQEVQKSFIGYTALRLILLQRKFRLPQYNTRTEQETAYCLYLKWILQRAVKRYPSLSEYLTCFNSELWLNQYPSVRSRAEIPECVAGLTEGWLRENYETERLAFREHEKQKKAIGKKLEKAKTKYEERVAIWTDIQAEIETLKEEIKGLRDDVKAAEIVTDRKILREKINQKKSLIQKLKEKNKTKETKQQIRELKQELKHTKWSNGFDHERLFKEYEGRITETFFSNRMRYESEYGSGNFPFVYDPSNDIEKYTCEEHTLDDYDEAERLHEKLFYWKQQVAKYLKLKYNTYNIRGLKRGKLDRFKLHKPFAMFKKVEKIKKKTHAISILISANTYEEVLKENLDFAFILSEALRPLKVAVEVIVFRAEEKQSGIDDDRKKKYARLNHSVTYEILKDFRDRTSDQILRSVKTSDRAFDAEALKFASNRLLKRKEKFKWLVYIAGGSPDSKSLSYTGVLLKEIREDIRLIGMGSGSAWMKTMIPEGTLFNGGIDEGMGFFIREIA